MQENNSEYLICENCLHYVDDVDDDGNCSVCARKIQKKNRKKMIDINLTKFYKSSIKK